MKHAISLVLLMCIVPVARAQDGCYGGAYQPALSAVYCGQQSQVGVSYQPVQVAVPQVQYQVVQVAAPSPCQAQFAAPLSYGVAAYGGFNTSFGYGGQVGFNRGFNYGVGFNHGFNNRGFSGGFNGFSQVGGNVGGGITVQAADRRGTNVVANGQNNVRIRRGLFGNIRSVEADQRGSGLLGRIFN